VTTGHDGSGAQQPAVSGAVVAAFPNLFRSQGHRRLLSLVVAAAILTLGALVFFARREKLWNRPGGRAGRRRKEIRLLG